ncbi:F0F1 ATP synthase subunit B [Parasporobacterium paucivorans]|uniref:ATP synthase subunit b n=1 Tax=Parasporobacterium paucivorans DSM 15970 TaxID=1122934 RepID=A0A1M6FLP4_9FIRM|nr:F0F1 ATP synthase subunit B [Parasporobacterium paucivorans]SHI98586.1 F-type H+-transporting ATPase subunit b [Parasporobacterium paucivorans DSM 15970]
MLSLDLTFLWTIIDLIILFLILKKFLFKPLLAVIEKRKSLIDDSLSSAEEKEASAFALQEKYEYELNVSKVKSDELINESREKAQKEYERILAEAKLEAARIMETAGKNIEMQKKSEFEKMQSSIVDIAAAIAMKASEESIDEEKSRKLLKELLMKAGA